VHRQRGRLPFIREQLHLPAHTARRGAGKLAGLVLEALRGRA
jgi:hypothetical protein